MRGPEELMTGFERDPDRAEDLAARIEDVSQEAIDATATAYTDDATIDVEERLAVELRSRGVRADADALAAAAGEIRSGHRVHLGRSDGSTA